MEKEIILSKKIESVSPVLSPEVRNLMWQKIGLSLSKHKQQPTPSPFLVNFITYKSMTALILLLTIVLGGGATALASDASRPGDLLFPLDRALEDVQLNLTFSAVAFESLTKKLTSERLQELREIINEEVTISPSNILNGEVVTSSDATPTNLFITATVFSNTTVIKMEQDGQTFYFETKATTLADVIEVVQERFPILSGVQIIEAITLLVKDRESLPNDKGVVVLSKNGEKRINKAVKEVLRFLNKTSNDDLVRKNQMAQLSMEVAGVTGDAEVQHNIDGIHIGSADSKLEIKMGDDGTSQISVRGSDDRVRVEEKDDDVFVRTAKVSDENNEDAKSKEKAETNVSFQVEAKIFTDTTIVRIEFGDQKALFTTVADTRADIISAIKEQIPSLTEGQINSQLKIEVKDRKSKLEDVGKNDVVTPLDSSVVNTSAKEKHIKDVKQGDNSYRDELSDSRTTDNEREENNFSQENDDEKDND